MDDDDLWPEYDDEVEDDENADGVTMSNKGVKMETKEQVYGYLTKFKGSGISFSIAMQHEAGPFSVHDRQDNPCYGELRKYEKSHPGQCTQKKNGRPSDLYWPFPEGTPFALAVTWDQWYNTGSEFDTFIESATASTSPWIRGLKEPELIRTPKGHVRAMVLKDLAIDPTVLVSFLNYIKSMIYGQNGPKLFNKMKAEGLTNNEALAVCMLQGGHTHTVVMNSGGYYFPTAFSAKRFFGQNPKDLSGGFLKDRVDYNRTLLAEIFQSDDQVQYWGTLMKPYNENNCLSIQTGKHSRELDWPKFAAACREVLTNLLETEKEPVDVPYIHDLMVVETEKKEAA